MTLRLLWEEYRGTSRGYSLSRFCELYQGWRTHLAPVMRQTHRAGERMFVDFAGQTVNRMVHHAQRVELKDDSLRRRQRSRMTLAPVGPKPSPARAAASAIVKGTRPRARRPSVDYGDELQPA